MFFKNRQVNQQLNRSVGELESLKLTKRVSLNKMYSKLSELIAVETRLGRSVSDNPQIGVFIDEIQGIIDKFDEKEEEICDRIRGCQELLNCNGNSQSTSVAVSRR